MSNIGTSHAHNAGYFVNNVGLGGRERQEFDIQTCKHCQCVIKLQDASVPYGFCRKCDHVVCGPCATKMQTEGCLPYVKFVEQAFNASAQLAQFRRLAGLDAPPADYQPSIYVGVP